jgi:S1-C subfamily serine protease
MKQTINIKFVFIISVLMIVSLACGLGSKPSEEAPVIATEAPQEGEILVEEPALQAPSTASEGGISKLKDVQSAVVQIEAQGTFVDPSFGEYTGAGRGSGFIIDPSGIAVTNNHVVTGAGLLKVWVGGDTSQEYSAKVLGVSECSDLAVIKIDGVGFPFLNWYQGSIDVGMDMYIAGFPLGDPEFTLTKGIISKAKADGITAWSSIADVLEYDATSNPGNSGGPVITSDGQVIAVHYWGNAETRQARGISRDIAMPVVDELRAGANVDTVGINGQAVSNEDGTIYGIWVSSVQAGSPADKAGLKGGDLLTDFADLPMADDGTMGKYCEVLRSHDPSETLNIKAVRWETGEMLEGQLNGREISVVGSFEGATGTNGDAGGEDTGTSSDIAGTEVNANASQPGDYYYSTDFDAIDDWTVHVEMGDDSDYSTELRSGKYRVEILDNDTWVYFENNTFTYKDVQLETQVENLGQNTNFTGLFCRFSDEGWYEANILNTGEYYIYLANLKTGDLETLRTGGSTLINMGKEINQYSFICKDDELTLGINGYEVITVPTKQGSIVLREGTAGIFVASAHVFPLMVEFDWFTASVPY